MFEDGGCYDDGGLAGTNLHDDGAYDDDFGETIGEAVATTTRADLDGLSPAEISALAAEAARLGTLLADGAAEDPGCAFGSATYFVHLAAFAVRCRVALEGARVDDELLEKSFVTKNARRAAQRYPEVLANVGARIAEVQRAAATIEQDRARTKASSDGCWAAFSLAGAARAENSRDDDWPTARQRSEQRREMRRRERRERHPPHPIDEVVGRGVSFWGRCSDCRCDFEWRGVHWVEKYYCAPCLSSSAPPSPACDSEESFLSAPSAADE